MEKHTLQIYIIIDIESLNLTENHFQVINFSTLSLYTSRFVFFFWLPLAIKENSKTFDMLRRSIQHVCTYLNLSKCQKYDNKCLEKEQTAAHGKII